MVGTRSKAAFFPCFADNERTKRVLAQKWQTNVLKACFRENSHPDQKELDRLAAETNLTLTWVRNWFMRERRKHTKLDKVAPEPTPELSPDFISKGISSRGTPGPEDYSHEMDTDSVAGSSVLEIPLSFRSLTQSPSLGYIPLAFSSFGNDTIANELFDDELLTLGFSGTAIPNVDVGLCGDSVTEERASSYVQNEQLGHSPASQSPCMRMLSQITEQLVSEAEAAEASSHAVYTHGYSSFFAGIPTQPSFNTNDFTLDSLYTGPSQSVLRQFSSCTLEHMQTTSPSIACEQPNASKHSPLPLAIDVNLTELMKMSRRITESYDAYLKSTQMEEDLSRELLEWVQSHEDSHGSTDETMENIVPIHSSQAIEVSKDENNEDTEDEGDEAVTPPASNMMLSPLTTIGSKRVPNERIVVVDDEVFTA